MPLPDRDFDVTEVVWAPPASLRDEDLAFPSHANALRFFLKQT